MSHALPFEVTHYMGTKVSKLTNLVISIGWGGNVAEAGRNCTITLKNTKDSENRIFDGIECGQEIRCSKRGTEFFRGIIFKTDMTSNGNLTITAYDYNYYLVKNSDSKKFVKKKASQIVTELCKQYGISYGTIHDTGYVIPKLILRDRTLYDMIVIALTETRKKTGKIFLLGNEKGKLTLKQFKEQTIQLVVKDATNLLSASYSESIEDMKNSIRLTGSSGEDSKGVTVSDQASIKKYGMLRAKQHENEKTDAQLKPIATALLKELNVFKKESLIEAIGDTSIISGRVLRAYEHMTKIQGGFYVTSDEHSFDANGTHKMNLVLSRSLDVAQEDYEAPEEGTTTSSVSTNKKATSNSKSSVNSKRDNVVKKARSYVGKLRYVFGGKSITNGTGDCSGFTNFIYLHAAGINIGHGTSSQVMKGRSVSKSAAQPGDIVFFKGTYRSGVSHVGIVTKPGYCISLASSGCKEHSYTSGYWGSHYMQIRSVL